MNTADDCIHLTLGQVRMIHLAVLEAHGGADGVRDDGMLDSAVAAPQATFGGKSVYTDLVEIAAAYLFYLCQNHPFIDGYKRTAAAAAIVFLRLNQIATPPDSPDFETMVLDVAGGRIDREQTTVRLRALLAVAG